MFDDPKSNSFSAEDIVYLGTQVNKLIQSGKYNIGEVLSALASVIFTQLEDLDKELTFSLLDACYDDYQNQVRARKAGLN